MTYLRGVCVCLSRCMRVCTASAFANLDLAGGWCFFSLLVVDTARKISGQADVRDLEFNCCSPLTSLEDEKFHWPDRQHPSKSAS